MKKSLCALFILLVLIACQPAPTRVPNLTPEPSSTVGIPALEATKTTSLTDTPIKRTLTPSYIPEAHLSVNCSDPNSTAQSQSLDGWVLFYNRTIVDGKYAPGVFSKNMNTGDKVSIENKDESLLYFKESPDKTHVAYKQINNNQVSVVSFLVIATADFKHKEIIPWKEDWGTILSWSDDSHIVFGAKGKNSSLSAGGSIPGIIIFETNSKAERVITPEFPDVYDFSPLPSWYGWIAATYNSAFDRAVYLHRIDQNTYGFALWDLEKHQIITTLPIVEYPMPLWSPDGSQFITTKFSKSQI